MSEKHNHASIWMGLFVIGILLAGNLYVSYLSFSQKSLSLPGQLEVQAQALLQMQKENDQVYDTVEGWVQDTTDRLVEVERYAYTWDASDEIYWQMESLSRSIYSSLQAQDWHYSELNLELQKLSTILDTGAGICGNVTTVVDVPCVNITTEWFEVYVYDENCTRVTSLYFPREWLEAIVQDVISKYWGSLGSRYDRRLPEE